MSPLDRLLVAVVLLGALWWACARHRRAGCSIGLADMTRTTADAITAFAAPALGIASAQAMPLVLALHASLHAERHVAATGV
jgi:hypothetical protein